MDWDFFRFTEFTCPCGCNTNNTSPIFIDKLEVLRGHLKFPLVITSGFRCQKYNNEISSSGWNGPHTTGRAADVLVDRGKAFELLAVVKQFGFTGVGIKQRGNNRFIHLDDLPNGAFIRPTIWSY